MPVRYVLFRRVLTQRKMIAFFYQSPLINHAPSQNLNYELKFNHIALDEFIFSYSLSIN